MIRSPKVFPPASDSVVTYDIKGATQSGLAGFLVRLREKQKQLLVVVSLSFNAEITHFSSLLPPEFPKERQYFFLYLKPCPLLVHAACRSVVVFFFCLFVFGIAELRCGSMEGWQI